MTVDSVIREIAEAIRERDADRALPLAERLLGEPLNPRLKKTLTAVVAALRTVKVVNSPYTWSLCESALEKFERELFSYWKTSRW